MNAWEIIFVVVCVVLCVNVAATTKGLFELNKAMKTYNELSEFSLVCIAEKCSEWITGNAWQNTYCKKNGSDEQSCSFQIEGKNYTMPLSSLNTSSLQSCIKKSCAAQILAKNVEVQETWRKD